MKCGVCSHDLWYKLDDEIIFEIIREKTPEFVDINIGNGLA